MTYKYRDGKRLREIRDTVNGSSGEIPQDDDLALELLGKWVDDLLGIIDEAVYHLEPVINHSRDMVSRSAVHATIKALGYPGDYNHEPPPTEVPQ